MWRPFWHPLSTVFLGDPHALATPSAVRLLLRAQGEVEVVYAGDRMAPAVGHGQRVKLRPLDQASVEPGSVVLACPPAGPDLLRVVTIDASGVTLAGDADVAPPETLAREALLAGTGLPRREVGAASRRLRRFTIDLEEALRCRPESEDDLAESVRVKYDHQAPFYATARIEGLEPWLRDHLREHVPRDEAVLVAGSGVGNECFDLAEEGRPVKGVDFAPAMVDESRRRATERGLGVEFVRSDLRSHEEPAGSLSAIVFTWDVYSFVPSARERREMLRRMRRWLRDSGFVYLSARIVASAYERFVLTLERLPLARTGTSWGASHTRWIDVEGRVRRSFVQLFTPRALSREIESAGLELVERHRGHVVLRARRDG